MVPVFPPVLEGAPVPTPPLVAPGLAGDVVVAGDVLVPGVVIVAGTGPRLNPYSCLNRGWSHRFQLCQGWCRM